MQAVALQSRLSNIWWPNSVRLVRYTTNPNTRTLGEHRPRTLSAKFTGEYEAANFSQAWYILRRDLDFHQYKIHLTEGFRGNDDRQRNLFAHWASVRLEEDPGFWLKNNLKRQGTFSVGYDEVNPPQVHQMVMYPQKITVAVSLVCTSCKTTLVRPFSSTVSATDYLTFCCWLELIWSIWPS